ncbi:MAG TPA: MarR family winged helix-turn-helix transcriptional regulator [Stellaceae bacterium]|nr:MarR family winged helix-turn-helix transcriptional regulator [Stellaceae bacterium]
MLKTDGNQIVVTGVEQAATCLCFHAQRAARSLARRFDDAFRPVNLTNGQYSLLLALSQTGPVSIGGLADALGMDRTTLTAALKPLTRQGRVAIAADPADKRNRRVALTKSGHAALRAARPIWLATHREIEKRLGPDGPDRLRQDLRALF